MTYRVIQWATGNVGGAALAGILDHPALELVGVRVYSADKVGLDAGELVGRDPTGVRTTDDVDAICALDADCVVYTPMLADPRDVIRLLESGKNVVTPTGWFYPDAASAATVEAACQQGGVSLHGTGIHPGGITERFPIVLSALCTNIEHVQAEEFSDIRNYDTEAVVRDIMLFGHPPEAARQSPMIEILGAGFLQSIDMVAAALGVELDADKLAHHEMAVATQDLHTPVGLIEKGTVAAQRFTWQGTVGGTPVITARVNWLMGEEHLDPPWRLDGERFEVSFVADPPLHVTFDGLHPPVPGEHLGPVPGIVATAMHCVNAVPAVCDAAPGIRTYLDLPPYAGRLAHPDQRP